MQRALAFLDAKDVRSVRLDATAFGQPLYERLGFVGEYHVDRYYGAPEAAGEVTVSRVLDPNEISRLIELDQYATGTDRARLLHRLVDERPGAVRVVESRGELTGYHAERLGSRAVQFGPCIARCDVGSSLLSEAFARHRGKPVIVDILNENESAAAVARKHGLIVQRQFLRMCRGQPVAR